MLYENDAGNVVSDADGMKDIYIPPGDSTSPHYKTADTDIQHCKHGRQFHVVRSGDGYDFASILCKYTLRKGDLFVLSWARVRRVSWESISSELLMCGGDECSILLLPLVAR